MSKEREDWKTRMFGLHYGKAQDFGQFEQMDFSKAEERIIARQLKIQLDDVLAQAEAARKRGEQGDGEEKHTAVD